VVWKPADGDKLHQDINHGGCADAGRKETVRLENVSTYEGLKIEEGDEVWAHIAISLGKTKNCRKDSKRLVYDPNGGTVTYKTGGTTLNNNRCRIQSTP
jgi:hypothetical protein